MWRSIYRYTARNDVRNTDKFHFYGRCHFLRTKVSVHFCFHSLSFVGWCSMNWIPAAFGLIRFRYELYKPEPKPLRNGVNQKFAFIVQGVRTEWRFQAPHWENLNYCFPKINWLFHTSKNWLPEVYALGHRTNIGTVLWTGRNFEFINS